MIENKINLITAPDILYNKAFSIFLVSPSQDIKKGVEEYIKTYPNTINIYMYDNSTKDPKWLLQVANLVDLVIIDVDIIENDVADYLSYLLSLPKTWYRGLNTNKQWDLISNNKFFEFTEITSKVLV